MGSRAASACAAGVAVLLSACVDLASPTAKPCAGDACDGGVPAADVQMDRSVEASSPEAPVSSMDAAPGSDAAAPGPDAPLPDTRPPGPDVPLPGDTREPPVDLRPPVEAAAPDLAPDQRPPACDPAPRDVPVVGPIAVAASGGMVALTFRSAAGELRVRRVDAEGEGMLSTRLAADWLTGGNIVPAPTAGRVLVTYHESRTSGWNGLHLVEVALASGQAQDVDLGQSGHHQMADAIATRGTEIAVVFRNEDHSMMPTAYGTRMHRRANISTPTATTAGRIDDPRTMVGTASGYLVHSVSGPNHDIERLDAAGVFKGEVFTTPADGVTFVSGAAQPTLVRASGGGVDLVRLTDDGAVSGAPRVVVPEGGAAVTSPRAVARGADIYVAYREGTTSKAVLVTTGAPKALPPLTGVTGSHWLVDDGRGVLRVAVRGQDLRVERLCP